MSELADSRYDDTNSYSEQVNLSSAEKTNEELLRENEELKRKSGCYNKLTFILAALLMLALGAIVGILIQFDQKTSDEKSCTNSEPAKSLRNCGSAVQGFKDNVILLGEPEEPSLFHDLTATEMVRLREYLEQTVGVANPVNASLADPHIYMMDLEPPKKADALNYLDNSGVAPDRYARVVLFRGDLSPPVVQEHLCGPLNRGNISCQVDLEKPFASRPVESREYTALEVTLIPEIHRLFGDILRESYNASFDYENCEDDCFNFFYNPVVFGRYGSGQRRKVWFAACYDMVYYSMFPTDFGVLCDVDGVDETKFSIEKVWYSGTMYPNPQALLDAYNNGTANKTRISRPAGDFADYATFKAKEPLTPTETRRPPELIEPDGKRYSIRHRKIEYLDMWSLYFRMSTIKGPSLFDIRFRGERIAYEISLQELLVFYSGNNPLQRQVMYVDSIFLTGSRSKALVAGADCPSTATFLPLVTTGQSAEGPVIFPNAICVFEQNLARPLRRHHSYSIDEGAFYGGMADSALVIRTIHAVDNYDYAIDFMFHQDGSMGVTIGQTGYLYTGLFTQEESPYAFQIRDKVFSPLHQHYANFKVDVDVNGTSNRYETLDVEEETVQLRQADIPEFTQTRFSENLKRTESEAAYVYDFSKPMYHIFHNDAARNSLGVKKAYSVSSSGISKQMLARGVGNEPLVTWARYQLAVTKRKDNEQSSASVYNVWGEDVALNFQSYIDDNESIVDQDLVAWITVGVHHIVHSEDIPVVAMAGKHQGFHLHPFNYFPECPSMYSRDGVVITRKDMEDPDAGIEFEYHGTSDVTQLQDGGVCQNKPVDTSAFWLSDPDNLVETKYNKGVL